MYNRSSDQNTNRGYILRQFIAQSWKCTPNVEKKSVFFMVYIQRRNLKNAGFGPV